MKTKIKKIAFAAVSAGLIMPALALAQLNTSGLGTAAGVPSGSITDIVTNIMKWLMYLVGILGVIGFAIAGVMYLTAAADEEQIDKAKKLMLAAITGVIVALLGLVILTAVKGMLGGQSTTF